MIGKFVYFFIIGTLAISSVFLVAVSKVLMPLSHKMTSSLPPFKIYSAAAINSFILFAKPLFNSTGLFSLPSSVNKEKFCIFLAPT